ncbi:MAG: class I SAM-dependent methyltransferase [Candidatus Kerfeldbacteria bacterium]
MDGKTAERLMSQIEADYDTISDHFAQTRLNQWYEVDFLIDQYVKPEELVLDLGCGNGRVADLVNQIKAKYVGLDVSDKLIAIAREQRPGNDFRVGNMLRTGFEDQTFDHVLMIASLHHIPSDELRQQALEEAKRITKRHGFIIMTNWNLRQMRFAVRRWKFNLQTALRMNELDWNDMFIPWYDQKQHLLASRYYHAFTPGELKRLAKKTGLTVIDQYYETNGMHVARRNGQNIVTVLSPES